MTPSGPGHAPGPTPTAESKADSALDSHWVDQALLQRSPAMARWIGWRLRLLLVLALLGSAAVFALLRQLSTLPHLDAHWRTAGDTSVELLASDDVRLRPWIGRRLQSIELADGRRIAADATLLQRSPRWIVNDAQRLRQRQLQDALGQALAQPRLRLHFSESERVELNPMPRGFQGLGVVTWLLAALALALYLIGVVVALSSPGLPNALYALVTVGQAGNLLLIATESMSGIGVAAGFARLDLALRTLCDMVTAGAVLHASLIHPVRLPRAGTLAVLAWTVTLGFSLTTAAGSPASQWWLTQGLLIACGLASVAVLSWSYRREPNPVSIVLRRLALAACGTLVLLTLAVALISREALAQHTIATIGSLIWYVFLTSLLLLVPFMSRSQHVMREFAMLAGISTVATSLDLLFVAVFSLGQFAALALSLFASLLLYAIARQWLHKQLRGSGMLSAERMFESLYRVAREIEAAPRKTGDQLTRLLRELFEPLELVRAPRTISRTRVAPDGSTLVVPVPRMPGTGEDDSAGALVLRYAHRGRRLFSNDDARLADRIIEQLQHVVAYDQAVEQGRSEERARIAQDLHDDIGARLLTLMYQAQTPEMEEYIRHTLQDLKTLTRGLARSSHRLSHSAAEWKADIAQRLTVASCELEWSFSADRDIPLTVVQWSGLTRVLRELVNNILAHAQATQVQIHGQYERGRLTLSVADNGIGRQPEAWSHGLGLGGVRKRVKLLGGEVRWRERAPQGIVCEVRVPLLGVRV